MNLNTPPTGLSATELTDRERSKALALFDDFQETVPDWSVTQTEADSWLAKLGETA